MSERLADIIEITMGQSPSGDVCNVQGKGLPLLNGPTEFGPHHPTPVQYTIDPRKFAESGDILFCVRGSTTGRMNWADQRYAIGRGVAAIRHRSGQRFQPLLRACIEWQLPTLLASATGSTFPNVTASMIGTLQAPQLGPDALQVADLFGQLDDKIELNRRMNETLERMAQAIFRDWFVDFGPVRRKLDGASDPVRIMGGITQDKDEAARLIALFPAALADNGLPEGWSYTKIENIAARIAMGPFGSRITKNNFVDAGVPVIRGKNLSDGFVDEGFVYLRPDKASELSSSKAKQGDIVLTHRGTLGQVGRIHRGAEFDEYIVSQSQMLLSVDLGKASPLAVYHFLRSDDGQFAWLANSGGAGVPAIARPTTSLKSIELVQPSLPVSDAFERIALLLEAKATATWKENQTLAAMRDLLLPKLMSGEIRLKDAEKIAEAAE